MKPAVVILCGGQGTRLREHTEHVPKPMVRIGNRPIVWHIMKAYSHFGFDDFVLCLGYKGERIREYFLHYDRQHHDCTVHLGNGHAPELHPRRTGHDHGAENWRVTLVDTGEAAMTGARLKRVARFLEGPRFLLTYGDGVCDVDVGRLLGFHLEHGRIGTVTGVHPPARFGQLLLDPHPDGAHRGVDRVVAFSEKPQVTDTYINGGFFVFERAFLDRVEDDDDCVLERAPLESLARDGELVAYRHDGFWQCMDTYRDWRQLDAAWRQGDAPWRVWRGSRP